MPLKINSKSKVFSLRNFNGKDADESVKEIAESEFVGKVLDCIGNSGYRMITMMGSGRRLEIICETDKKEEIANEEIPPRDVKWTVLDIFEYRSLPVEGQKFF